jgi:glycosyltransferase involved in cell wall biosynthesis
MPKVSVILTSFNHAKYIQEAIDSVLNQTFADFELIIWDDASSDNSWELINQYSDPRIKAFRNEEQKRGVWGINKAISEVTSGKYIAIHHSDDVWEAEKLEKQVALLDANPGIGAVFTNVSVISEDGSPLADEKHFYFNIFDQPNRTRHEWLRFFFNHGNALCHPSVLIRKSCYADCGLYRFEFAQLPDLDMWIRLCMKHEIHVLPEQLVRFRVRDNEANTSGNRLESRIHNLYESYKLLQNYRKFASFEDMVKVFPTAEKYRKSEGTDIDFVLAMIILDETPSTSRQLLAQDLLFEAISDPKRSANVKRLYGFDYKSFIKLTAKNDVFSREEVDALWRKLAEIDQQRVAAVADRDAVVAVLRKEKEHAEELQYKLETAEQRAGSRNPVVPNETQVHQRNVIIFGAGEGGRRALRIAERKGWKALCFLDNNPSAWDTEGAAGIFIRPPSILESGALAFDEIIVASKPGKAAIFAQLEGMGFKAYEDFIYFGDLEFSFPDVDYAKWISRYDTLTDETRSVMRTRIKSFAHEPLISVLMPVYNPPISFLDGAVQSVRNQLYPNWELCIADDASTNPAVREALERYRKQDSRIKIVYRKQNGHISAASNSALELVSAEWVALMDHDDLLSEHALFWVADAINNIPEVRLIYSDEDKLGESGRRLDPYFKCDWNVDLFYSHNLITHLGVYRTDLVRGIGGFRIGMEGSQDYDLALRYIERIEQKQIYHIPRILYHWRMHAESTAQSADAKPYALLAGEKALNEHLQRNKIAARAELGDAGYRVRYSLPDIPPLASLIIPTRNGLALISACVKSITGKTTYPNYEILVVDNGSDDRATLKYLNELQNEPRVRVIRDDRPFNYSELNNSAVKLARGELVGLLNNDLEVISPDWLSEMVSVALQPGVGAVGASLWYPNKTLQHGGVILGLGGVAGHSHKGFAKGSPGYCFRMSLISGFSAVTGACLIIRKRLFEELGGLNETDLKIAFNDVDFCIRLREAGYRNVWTPYAELYHHESATRGYEDTLEKQLRYTHEMRYLQKRWGDLLLNDPAYSPNLTLDHEDFSYAWPPRVKSI